ncbi:MAG: hypothetical protein EAZ57_03890 [Cytophagales bacterium]|nr:MAG: hypothetical protein EAZ67_04905 [Cytophagales bacterium]TAF61352.1 MAG: hypothetical protein EAZ57_03890 [Cytophagales bacterium]
MKQFYTSAYSFLSFIIVCLGWVELAHAQQQSLDCDDAQPLCGSVDVTFKPLGKGKNDFDKTNNQKGCLNVENNTIWYIFQIETSGTLTFVISPDKENTDYDFSLWGPSPDCNNLGEPIRCNSSQPFGDTGLSMDSEFITQGPGPGSVWSKYLDVTAGEEYILVLDNFSNNTSSFKMKWGGTATLSEKVVSDFSHEITCDLLSTKNKSSGCYVDKFSYLWTLTDERGAVVMSSPSKDLSYKPSLAGNFLLTLTCTSPTGKVVKSSKSVFLEAQLSAKFEKTANCMNLEAKNLSEFCGSRPPLYTWELINASTNTTIFAANSADFSYRLPADGQYHLRLTAKDNFGTISVAQDTVFAHQPKLKLMQDTLVCFDDPDPDLIKLSILNELANYPYQISWYNLRGELVGQKQELRLVEGGLYKAIVQSGTCQDSISLTVVSACKAYSFIPSAFTPNNDQLNDVFQLFGKYVINYDFWVYDVWGEAVFYDSGSNMDQMKFWDGTWKGKSSPSGTYNWLFKYYSPERPYDPIRKQGAVTLIR